VRVLVLSTLLVACGDDGLPRAPATLTAGPVVIETGDSGTGANEPAGLADCFDPSLHPPSVSRSAVFR